MISLIKTISEQQDRKMAYEAAEAAKVAKAPITQPEENRVSKWIREKDEWDSSIPGILVNCFLLIGYIIGFVFVFWLGREINYQGYAYRRDRYRRDY